MSKPVQFVGIYKDAFENFILSTTSSGAMIFAAEPNP